MKLYLFKRTADGVWIFGNNVDCEHDIGMCRPVPNADRSEVTIIYNEKNEANPNIYDHPVTDFLKENGTAYADFAELKAGYDGFFIAKDSGIATGEKDAVLSDTEDLAVFGWIRPILLAGTIKYTTEDGDVRIMDFDKKETSLVRVRRVWLTGTTAGMGIVVYP